MNQSIVGLFGTCGSCKWRDKVIAELDKHGIDYFNPVVPNWTPALAEKESWHLANDDILVFVVTDEEPSFGALAEIGFAVNSVEESLNFRKLFVYVSPFVSNGIGLTPEEVRASNRTRNLVLAHLEKQKEINLHTEVFNSIEELTSAVISDYNTYFRTVN